jgi:prolyl 4-hydroxylase
MMATSSSDIRRSGSSPSQGEPILVLDDFLSSRECERIRAELDFTFWRPSLTYQRQPDEAYRHVLTETRVSETAHQDLFSNELLMLLGEIETRLSASFGVDPLMLESWQATRYPIGGKFDYHLDSGYWDDHYAGDRIRTFLIYLATSVAGGGTHFRALDVLVEARERRLVVWENLFPDGSPNHSMIHAGLPLLAGEKITLVTWQRQRAFRRTTSSSTKEVRAK